MYLSQEYRYFKRYRNINVWWHFLSYNHIWSQIMAQNYSSMLHVDNNAQGKYMDNERVKHHRIFFWHSYSLSCERGNSAKKKYTLFFSSRFHLPQIRRVGISKLFSVILYPIFIYKRYHDYPGYIVST